MTLIATVLRSGGDFTVEYVERLRDSVREYDFVCLSDVPVPCERIPLDTGLRGWWAKLELFRLPGPIVYFDLDTIITGDIKELVEYPHKFTVLRDFNVPHQIATGVMAWHGDYSFLLDKYTNRQAHNARGDSSWLEWQNRHGNLPVEHWQDLFPGAIKSYKLDDTEGAKVVCYHGKPRPHETGWAA